MLGQEVFLHILAFSLLPDGEGSFDNLFAKALVASLSRLLDHRLDLRVVLPIVYEIFSHFWLRRHCRGVNSSIAIIELLLVF